jgi:hypothetical protein
MHLVPGQHVKLDPAITLRPKYGTMKMKLIPEENKLRSANKVTIPVVVLSKIYQIADDAVIA